MTERERRRAEARARKRAQPSLPDVDTKRKGEAWLVGGPEHEHPGTVRATMDETRAPYAPAATTSVRERAPHPDDLPTDAERAEIMRAIEESIARSASSTVASSAGQLVLEALTPAEKGRRTKRRKAQSSSAYAQRKAERRRKLELRRVERQRRRDRWLAKVREAGATGFAPRDFPPRVWKLVAAMQSNARRPDGKHAGAERARSQLHELPRPLALRLLIAALTRDGRPGTPRTRKWTSVVARNTVALGLALYRLSAPSKQRGIARVTAGFSERMLASLFAVRDVRDHGDDRMRVGRIKGTKTSARGDGCGYLVRLKRAGFLTATQMRGPELLAMYPAYFGPPNRSGVRHGFNLYTFRSELHRGELTTDELELRAAFRAGEDAGTGPPERPPERPPSGPPDDA